MNQRQKKMDELFKEMEAIRGKAEHEKRTMTEKELERRSHIKSQISALAAEERSCHDEDALRTMLYGGPNDGGGPFTLTAGMENPVARGGASKGRDFRSLFGIQKGVALDRGGFQDFNEFLSLLHSSRADQRLKVAETRAMSIGTPSAGGFIVPEDFAAWILDASLEGEIVRPRATVWPMLSESKKVPGWDMSDHKNTLFGGLTAEWLAESGTATEVFAKLRQIMLVARKLACYTCASNELVADGVSFEEQLSGALVKTIGFYLDYSFIQGTGAGQPLGILNDPALITVAKETGQQTKTILYANVLKMFARLAPQCMKNAVWIANQTTIPQMLSMTITIGTGGAIAPAVTQQNGKFYLLTKEVLFTEKCPALSSKGDLILADLSQYSIGLRKEVSVDKSNAPGWLKDESSYRAIVRADGQGQWNSAITPKNGDSLSWCVTLADR
ncbi:MAG TPA: phage major capsid protein [Syntrophales bacterium]|nr:phage major capsid protein [Syntrophales bacterium]HOI17508.1 phage major capsid protein [Geobacteraceae bacterium]